MAGGNSRCIPRVVYESEVERFMNGFMQDLFNTWEARPEQNMGLAMYDSEHFAKTFFYMKRKGENELIDAVIQRLESELTEDITAMRHGMWSGRGQSTVRYNYIARSIAQKVMKTCNLSWALQNVKRRSLFCRCP